MGVEGPGRAGSARSERPRKHFAPFVAFRIGQCQDESVLLTEYGMSYKIQHLTNAQSFAWHDILLTSLMNMGDGSEIG